FLTAGIDMILAFVYHDLRRQGCNVEPPADPEPGTKEELTMLNNVTRWTPTTAYLNREPFARLFESFFNDAQGEEVSNRNWVPPVDIQETGDGYRLLAELPGLTKEDIQITLENNVLRLSG